MMINRSATMMFLSASLFTAPVLAQQAQPARPGVQVQVDPNRAADGVQVGTTATAAPINERTLASCVAIANQEEVAIAKMAIDKAKDKDVKEYAKMLVEDHQGFLKKLERFAPEAQEPIQASQSHAKPSRAARQTQEQTAENRPANQEGAAQSIDVVQLHREVAQQCLADASKKMNEKEGEKFDICFIGHQIANHEAMKTKLTVFQRHASGEFAQLLASGLETTDAHLKKAEKIMKDLDHDHGSNKNEKKDRNEK